MTLAAQLLALTALLGTAVVFGTDAFCALVQRPAIARVGDGALTAVMGEVHRYGDRRMPVPALVGLLAAALAAVLAATAGRPAVAVPAGAAVLLWIVWLAVYRRVSAPINRRLTAAVDRGETPADARALQAGWDRVIVLRAVLLGLAVVALGLGLLG